MTTFRQPDLVIYVLGGNETASATALSLHKSGFPVIAVASEKENLLRYNLSIGDVLQGGQKILEGVTATAISEQYLSLGDAAGEAEKNRQSIHFLFKDRKLPVIPLAEFADISAVVPADIIINFYPESITPVMIDAARLVVGIYPAHKPGHHCHQAIETRLSYYLGHAYTTENQPPEALDTSFFNEPFAYCQSPIGGAWVSLKHIGDAIKYNEAIGTVNGIEIRSPYDGQIWGLTHSGKIIDPRASVAQIYQHKPSDAFQDYGFREKAIAGSVLTTVLDFLNKTAL